MTGRARLVAQQAGPGSSTAAVQHWERAETHAASWRLRGAGRVSLTPLALGRSRRTCPDSRAGSVSHRWAQMQGAGYRQLVLQSLPPPSGRASFPHLKEEDMIVSFS